MDDQHVTSILQSESYDNTDGGMHTFMSFLGCIGNLMKGTGVLSVSFLI